jgi:hypothetical protein
MQTIVRRRDYGDFNGIAETALVEESAIVSKRDGYRNEGTSPNRCSSCGKTGQTSSKCYGKDRREARVNPVVARKPDSTKTSLVSVVEREDTWQDIAGAPRGKGKALLPRNSGKREETDGEQPSSGRLYSICWFEP